MGTALFIAVEVDASISGDPAAAAKLAEACPVDIFEAGDAGVTIVDRNLDECTLCDLCKEAFPGKVTVKKLYEE